MKFNLSMIMVLALPVAATAAWTVNNATSPTALANTDGGWNLTVKKENNALTITKYVAGSGDLDLASCEADTGWKVAKVDSRTFSGNTAIKSFIGPDVTNVGSSGFLQSSGLTNVVFSANLSAIGEQAFRECKALKTFYPTMLSQLTSLGGNIFYSCTALTGDFKLPAIRSMPQTVFYYTKISSLEIPVATTIANSVCSGASALTNLVVSESLTSIGTSAFQNCKALKTLTPTTLPVLASVGDYAFYDAIKLTGNFVLPALRSIGGHSFQQTAVRSFVATNLVSVGSSSFSCTTVTSVLTNFVMSADATSIGASAFYNCRVMKFSPSNLSKLTSLGGTYVFYNCMTLTGDFVMPKLPSLPQGTFYGAKITSLDVRSATSIGSSACSGNSLLTNLVTSATSFGEKAFYNCAAGMCVWWYGRTAPTLAQYSIDPSGSARKARIFVHNARDREGWEAICSRTTPTAADKARADFPGAKRLIGVIASNNNDAWVLREGELGTVVQMR